jgi:transglutaminase-like putative cysteine protease
VTPALSPTVSAVPVYNNRRFYVKKIGFLLLFVLCVTPAWAKSRSGSISMEIDLGAAGKGQVTRLWLPYPVSDRQQTISDLHVSGDFASSGVYTDTVNSTPILYAEWPKEATTRKLSITFAAERQEMRIDDLKDQDVPWNRVDYAEYLGATTLGPIDGAVKTLVDEIVRNKKSVYAKAQAIYDWTVENMYRDPTTIGCGKGDVCLLLMKPGGKCTDISSVFVALCRAAGVPAREVFGLRLGKKAQEDITGGQHCWAEFFLPGRGWVPADPADVRKAILVENLEAGDARIKGYRDYFWGGIDPCRIKLAVGRDLILNPPQAGAPLNTFGYPYAEVNGQPLDFYDAKNFSYKFSFTER